MNQASFSCPSCPYGMRKTVTAEKDNFITRIESASGDIVMTEYSVFPGISLIYNDVNAEGGVDAAEPADDTVFEINHCREGRIECHASDDFFYLAPGYISAGSPAYMESGSYFPPRR